MQNVKITLFHKKDIKKIPEQMINKYNSLDSQDVCNKMATLKTVYFTSQHEPYRQTDRLTDRQEHDTQIWH